MATLVLTAVGSAVGGPIGGAIGAIIGQQVDSAVFAPKPRQGPRLGDLAVQTSSYGTTLPKIFGRMRVAGTVIWATDLQEHRSSSGGGKGRPKTVGYSYSASFAVALSARAIGSVGRIWADGKLLRGAAGDFKTSTGFRLYLGDEEQNVDPLIAAAEGIGGTPAYRGLAYAVFEDFQLADYGNRIPSLSFEIEADEGPVTIGSIAAELSGDLLVAGETPSLIGYAAGGDSVRGAIEDLVQVTALSMVDTASALRLGLATGAPVDIVAEETGSRVSDAVGGRTEVNRSGNSSVPAEVGITYLDPSRDWQTSLQRAYLFDTGSHVERIGLPAALEAQSAKAMAEARLGTLWSARSTARLHLGWRRTGLKPGTLVQVEDLAGLWRIERCTLQRMIVTLELVRVAAGVPPETSAMSGRPVREADLIHGPTVLHLLDIPFALPGGDDRPRLLVAASGPEPGWRRAELSTSFDGGASWGAAGTTATPAVMGSALSILGASGSVRFDAANSFEVELLNEAMWLESRDDEALVNGENLALLGNELIQFGRVVPLGERRFRLSRLLRGRWGTEWAAATHAEGDAFVVLEPEALLPIEVSLGALGVEARVMARGLGDETAVTATCPVTAEALRPPTLVHLRAQRQAGGDIAISWVRRSRSGWAWLDGIDAPLAEEQERYTLRLITVATTRTVTLGEPGYLYSAAAQAGDGGGLLTVEVTQAGTFAASRAAITTVERP